MKLPTDPYKGVRDFYPEEMSSQKYIFKIWRDVVEKYGYEEYNASVLESTELYKAKSGEEIINDQTYTFKDRGEREVTLRPEMTPTVARMVAARRRELVYPLRWYSIPNLFRYEQPQRGRLREHWQLNVDIFGVEGCEAEIEMIQIAHEITCSFVSSPKDFEIRINSRKILDYITRDIFKLDFENSQKLLKLMDRKRKVDAETFAAGAKEVLKDERQCAQFLTLLHSQNFEEFTSNLQQTKEEHEGLREVHKVISALEKLGITNARFEQSITRGQDYYTGIIFEVFDNNPENRRSVFGGGRYDDLLDLFGQEKVAAVGFGAGDVVLGDMLETYGKNKSVSIPTDIMLCVMDIQSMDYAREIASQIREKGIRVAVDFSGRKVGDQIRAADKRKIPYVIVIGESEQNSGEFKLKNLSTGEERVHTIETVNIK